MWPVSEIGVNLFQASLMAYFVNKRCNLRNHPVWYDIALAMTITLAICGTNALQSPLLDNAVLLIPLVYSLWLRQTKILASVFWCVVLCFIFTVDATITSGAITLLTNSSWEDMLRQNDVRVLYIISADLMHTLLIAGLGNLGPRRHILSAGITICFLLSLLIQFVVAACFFSIRVSVSEITPTVTYGSIGALAAMILTVLFYEMMIRQAEKQRRLELEAQTVLLAENHQEEIRSIYSNMLSTQHDLRHRITVAEKILAANGACAPQEAIDLLKDTKVLNEYITGNVAMDAILASKTAVMQEAGIRFDFYPVPLNKLPLPERQFIVMISNILDNAIEGVMRLPAGSASKEIKLLLSRNWDIFSIVCENNMDPQTIIRNGNTFVSSKKDPAVHGYGTRNIRKIVEDAGGLVDYVIEGQTFTVKILLPMEE